KRNKCFDFRIVAGDAYQNDETLFDLADDRFIHGNPCARDALNYGSHLKSKIESGHPSSIGPPGNVSQGRSRPSWSKCRSLSLRRLARSNFDTARQRTIIVMKEI